VYGYLHENGHRNRPKKRWLNKIHSCRGVSDISINFRHGSGSYSTVTYGCIDRLIGLLVGRSDFTEEAHHSCLLAAARITVADVYMYTVKITHGG